MLVQILSGLKKVKIKLSDLRSLSQGVMIIVYYFQNLNFINKNRIQAKFIINQNILN